MKLFINGVVRHMTDEEIATIWETRAKSAVEERKRPLTESEITHMLIKSQINTIEVDDNTALRMIAFYPSFDESIGRKVKQGYKFTYGDKLYKVAQPELTIEAHYPPEAGTESLYTRIDETHDGSKYDPIPYEGNMALEQGKCYTQNGVLYLCTRDTGNAVHHTLAELVGLYVEEVK